MTNKSRNRLDLDLHAIRARMFARVHIYFALGFEYEQRHFNTYSELKECIDRMGL